jgi:hypothetical protein
MIKFSNVQNGNNAITVYESILLNIVHITSKPQLQCLHERTVHFHIRNLFVVSSVLMPRGSRDSIMDVQFDMSSCGGDFMSSRREGVYGEM